MTSVLPAEGPLVVIRAMEETLAGNRSRPRFRRLLGEHLGDS